MGFPYGYFCDIFAILAVVLFFWVIGFIVGRLVRISGKRQGFSGGMGGMAGGFLACVATGLCGLWPYQGEIALIAVFAGIITGSLMVTAIIGYISNRPNTPPQNRP
jgi:hypothetical protein